MSSDPDSPNALLAFFLGPVQPFIAGARTVRDLWTGSYLLSWLTFAAIRKILETSDAELVSPSVDRNPMLWTIAKTGKRPPDITTPCLPNRFIARIPTGVSAHKLALACEKACHDEWENVCKAVRAKLDEKIEAQKKEFEGEINDDEVNDLRTQWARFWDAQVSSFFEVRTAVLFPDQLTEDLRKKLLNPVPSTAGKRGVPLTDREVAMNVLFGLMDAHKSVRHVPNYRAEGDVPQKCTLLGTYEQMGPEQLDESRAFWSAFAKNIVIDGTRVRKGERLCAISLVKRFAWPAFFSPKLGLRANELSYSDTATVAASCWLPSETAAPDEEVNWRKLRDWSGQWLHWRKRDEVEDDEQPKPRVWDWIQERKRERGNAPTYYAILMADADKLGDEIASKGEKVSKVLTHFAVNIVRTIVEGDKYRGELIYSGGDDTLALLPTETAVACARAVQQAYEENWRQHFPEDKEAATLSAGIAVVHYKEDLRYALDVARQAEHDAKHFGRDALAIAVCRRSGEHTSAVLGWEQADDLNTLVTSFLADMSDRWTYKLRSVLPTFEGMPWECFAAELHRLLGRIEAKDREKRESFAKQVTDLASRYIDENRKEFRKRPTDKPSNAYAMADFVTLCQSASFLARGRDSR